MDVAETDLETLLALTDQNLQAIRRFYAVVTAWEADTSREVEDAVVGESVAGVKSTRSRGSRI
jgi:hypothetical protein